MDNEKIEILLVELSGASEKNRLSWRHSKSRFAPIGLYCLKAINKERIALIDVPVAQINDMFGIYNSSIVKTVICRLAEEPDKELINKNLINIRNYFKNAKIGCNYIKSDITKDFDFVINGTGKTSLMRLLRGDELSGYCDHMNNDMLTFLDIPSEPLIDVGYNMLPEKWLSVHNLEIWQPWQGLCEFSESIFTYPGLEWMTKLINWLKDSGFDAFHFAPSKWNVYEINQLRALIQKLNLTVSISFYCDNTIVFSDILLPVKRIWLYQPHAAKAKEVTEKLKSIRNAGFEACLQITYSWFGGGVTLPVCKYIDHIVINDEYRWSNIDYKKFSQRFWGTKNRFFVRLFNLRTASELINFLKCSYELLDILFLPDKKGENNDLRN